MSFVTTSIVLASAVADEGTVTVAYPAGTNQAYFTGANASSDGLAIIDENDVYAEGDPGIGLSYGGSNITLTNDTGVTWPAGATVRVQLGRAGVDAPAFQAGPAIDDAATRGASYVQAEANATVATVNEILVAMRAAGIIASS